MFLVFRCWHKLRKTFSFSRLYFRFTILSLSGVYSPTENLRWAHEFVQSCQNPEDRGSVPFWCPTTFFDIFVAFGTNRRSRAFSLFTLYDLKYLKFARVWRYEYLYWTENNRRYGHQIFGSQNVLCSKKKGDRRKERGSALPRLHGTDCPCDLLDLTFCEKTKEK